jgi:aryl-alcohol dehydrogenase-like predicted oxidoreductase
VEDKKMKKRNLGNNGPEVSPLAFGGNVFGWTVDEQTSFKLLDAFVSEGFDLIDTADVYSRWVPGNKGGESESIIGRWLQQSGNRQRVVLVTKVGMEMGTDRKGLSKSYILAAVEESLRRLRTDCIDVYLSHADDPEIPLEETLEAYAQLIGQGKIRFAGASNYDATRLSRALEIGDRPGCARYQCLEPLYNLYDRQDYEAELEPVCRGNGLGVITYYSLAGGFLTGKYRSESDAANSARRDVVMKYLNRRGLRILDALDQVAKELGATPAAVSIAWLLTRPTVTAPIASATSLEQLRALIEGTRLTLDGSSLELLNRLGEADVNIEYKKTG